MSSWALGAVALLIAGYLIAQHRRRARPPGDDETDDRLLPDVPAAGDSPHAAPDAHHDRPDRHDRHHHDQDDYHHHHHHDHNDHDGGDSGQDSGDRGDSGDGGDAGDSERD